MTRSVPFSDILRRLHRLHISDSCLKQGDKKLDRCLQLQLCTDSASKALAPSLSSLQLSAINPEAKSAKHGLAENGGTNGFHKGPQSYAANQV